MRLFIVVPLDSGVLAMNLTDNTHELGVDK